MLVTLLLLTIAATNAEAQKGDWAAVQRIEPGTRISVKLRLRTVCHFVSATENQLACKIPPEGRMPFLPSELKFERRKIRQVRLEHDPSVNSLAGMAIGMGTGAALGAAAGGKTLTRGGGAILMGGIGALFGGVYGMFFPVVHKKVVYKR
ncbi:MAG: hypothetical protein LAN84_07025 [Acidobacteriia bacterium]|nr:hypothetical protein [Terriglobia bacterium]